MRSRDEDGPVGEASSDSDGPRFTFNGAVHFEGREDRLTGDAGALLLREVDERVGLTAGLAAALTDPRNPIFVTHPLVELLRTRIYAMGLGHRDQDDADRLRMDPALRLSVSERRGTAPLEESEGLVPNGLSSQPTQSRLVSTLTIPENVVVLSQAPFDWAVRVAEKARQLPLPQATLDVDSLPIEVHGEQAGSANNGYYHTRCYHPITVMLHETSDFLAGRLRPGNVHSADGVLDFLKPVIARARTEFSPNVVVRGDADVPRRQNRRRGERGPRE